MRYVISLGGSTIVPKDIDIKFLKSFRELIIKNVKQGKQFVIVCGGGYTSRAYQNAARSITTITKNDADLLGISATRMNAKLVKTIFKDLAHPEIIKNPNEKIRTNKKIIIAAGWKPGWSTDYVAVLLSKNFRTGTILNISNIDYIYTADPKTSRSAKPIEKISWLQFIKLLPKKWSPGLSSPFDPVATKMASRLGLKVVVMGPDIKNIDAFLSGRKFKGTTIY